MNVSKIAYKPFGIALGAASGMLAGIVFKQVWKRVGQEEKPPDATDEERTWHEIVLAATLQGAVFAAVKAAADRGGATAFRRLTGKWPA
ncbi:DUF4235 domain-containing protein [Streptomyces tsukubensis]|uniref:DUF4235 domain-containing protein n=1 Tax=Streptomyces tsukubensis TaxID=83656 RepID=A0A1V4AGP0_9ACTN|nr:DUF4235 domain-containing protein [Streptomyces tsukubensis]OON82771.1 hypothetical protein B1H18_01665 [Streptomyces tsukubensis]QFR92053.1 DUF4235 domain-containing protein [Streptomyces tsukubensis]